MVIKKNANRKRTLKDLPRPLKTALLGAGLIDTRVDNTCDAKEKQTKIQKYKNDR